MLNQEDFRRSLAESGLTLLEVAKLYGVSRQTVHCWRTAAPPREGSYLARMAEVITKAILNAIDRKLLPLPASSREVRRARIEKMSVMLRNLKPAAIK